MTTRFKPRLAAWPVEPVLRRLNAFEKLSEAEEALVRGLSARRIRHASGDEIVAQGAPSRMPRFVVAGWAACQRVLPDGRRQIFGFLLPGDAFGFAPRAAPSPWSITALTALETFDAEFAAEAVAAGRAPRLARALAAAEVQTRQLLLDHMVRLGRLTAYERVSHFLLELQGRLQVAGLGDSQRFPLPLTQEMLADALGLSIVHVNRTLQQLRREGLIELRSGVAILLRPDSLAAVSNYDNLGALRRPAPDQLVKRPA